MQLNAVHVHIGQRQEMVDLLMVDPTQSPTWDAHENNALDWSIGIAILECDDMIWEQWA